MSPPENPSDLLQFKVVSVLHKTLRSGYARRKVQELLSDLRAGKIPLTEEELPKDQGDKPGQV